LFIWDDRYGKICGELELLKPIIDLKMIEHWIVVVTEDRVFPLNFKVNLGICPIEGGI